MKKLSLIQFNAIIIIILAIGMQYIYFQNTGELNSPILKFEFSENSQEIFNLFSSNNELRSDVISGIIDQNIIDFAYMTAYSSFLILIFIKLLKTERNIFFYFGIILASMAFICDIIENIQMFRILKMLIVNIDFSAYIYYLKVFTWIKWLSLSFALAILSMHYFKYKFLGKLFALISILPLTAGLVTLFNILNDFELYFSIFVMTGFIILIIWSFVSVLVSSSVSFYKIQS